MTTLTVSIQGTPSSSYPIYIDNEDLKNLKTRIDEETSGKNRLVVFSEKVYKLYGKALGFEKDEVFVLKDGEEQKNLKNFSKIIEKMISLKLSRKSVVVAIGGGVVGDMTGFAASVYMRGIDFIQVPTTLLAMVDSSVGGKTAIDMPKGKNFVGAFYQPKAVYINLNFLKTLDEKQYKSGFGEVIKYGFIEKSCNCSEYFDLIKILKENVENYKNRDNEFLKHVVEICLKLKSAVVEQDEKESGLRKILNLGHTFGHALEEETKYKRYTHGAAVVQGLIYIFKYALENNLCEKEYYNEGMELIKQYDYKHERFCCINKKNVLNYMKTDKKSSDGAVTFIVPTKYGEVFETKDSNPKWFG